MLELLNQIRRPVLSEEARRRLRETSGVNSAGFDPWGLHPETAEQVTSLFSWLYTHYFRVRSHGLERVPEGRVLLVPNHSGQIPFDGMLVGLAMLLEADPPRLVRGMVERWFPSLPFVSTLFSRVGQVVGDPENCVELLKRDQPVLVFPEGIRGSGKTWWKRYQLQRFGTGFVRIALETGTPIVPVSVVGAEETYPSVYDFKALARLLGMPYFPITPMFPLLGPLGVLPVPVQIDLYFGKPILFDGDPDQPEPDVQKKVDRVKRAIARQIARGLEKRPDLRALDSLAGGSR